MNRFATLALLAVLAVASAGAQTPTAIVAALDTRCRAEEDALVPRLRALDAQPTAERDAVAANLASARARCAAGDLERAVATYRHVAAFLAAGGFGDAQRAP